MKLIATAMPQRVNGRPSLVVTRNGREYVYDNEAALIRHLKTLGYSEVKVNRPKQVFCMCRTFHGPITIYGREQ